MIQENIQSILEEIKNVVSTVDQQEIDNFTRDILKANTIVLIGAGRVGLAVRGFAMRLAHLGLDAHMLGDATVPSIAAGDVLVVASGSGETQTIYDIVSLAKDNGADILLFTGNPDSRMGKKATGIIKVQAPSKTKPVAGLNSIQPMTTLNEQCLSLLFDAIVLELMAHMRESHDTMWARHSNLE